MLLENGSKWLSLDAMHIDKSGVLQMVMHKCLPSIWSGLHLAPSVYRTLLAYICKTSASLWNIGESFIFQNSEQNSLYSCAQPSGKLMVTRFYAGCVGQYSLETMSFLSKWAVTAEFSSHKFHIVNHVIGRWKVSEDLLMWSETFVLTKWLLPVKYFSSSLLYI